MSSIYFARNPRVAARSLDGEMMIMSSRDSTLFTLNKTATVLWQSADGKTPLEEIVNEKICNEFNVQPGDALQDATHLLKQLAEHEILIVSEAPIGQANSAGVPR